MAHGARLEARGQSAAGEGLTFKQAQNPGNINVRLGSTMALKEAAQDRGDWGSAAIHLEQMATYILPVAGHFDSANAADKWDKMAKYRVGDDRSIDQAVLDHFKAERWLLGLAKQGGIFARKPDMEITDADEGEEAEAEA